MHFYYFYKHNLAPCRCVLTFKKLSCPVSVPVTVSYPCLVPVPMLPFRSVVNRINKPHVRNLAKALMRSSSTRWAG